MKRKARQREKKERTYNILDWSEKCTKMESNEKGGVVEFCSTWVGTYTNQKHRNKNHGQSNIDLNNSSPRVLTTLSSSFS